MSLKKSVKDTARSLGYYVGTLPVDTLAEHLRELGYRGRIVSFEPITESFAILKERAARDRDRVVHHMALGDRETTLTMNVARLGVFTSFLKPTEYSRQEFKEFSEVVGTQSVIVRRLDAVFEESLEGLPAANAYLKLDTQGYDRNVLEGASGSLAKIKGIQSEVSVNPIYEGTPGYMESIAHLNKLGFALTGLFPVTRDRQLCVVELDCVMRRLN